MVSNQLKEIDWGVNATVKLVTAMGLDDNRFHLLLTIYRWRIWTDVSLKFESARTCVFDVRFLSGVNFELIKLFVKHSVHSWGKGVLSVICSNFLRHALNFASIDVDDAVV